MKVFIADYDYDVNGRRRISAVLQWGGTEALNPKDVGLETIDTLLLSNANITPAAQAFPIGSVPTLLGSQDPGGGNIFYRGGGPGSTVTLRWTAGSSGTRVANLHGLGTLSTGTKTAHALIYGQTG